MGKQMWAKAGPKETEMWRGYQSKRKKNHRNHFSRVTHTKKAGRREAKDEVRHLG